MSVVDPNGGGAPIVPGDGGAPPAGTGVVEVSSGAFRTPARDNATVLSGLGGVPTSRTLAGLSLAADRSASDLLTPLDAARVTSWDFSSATGWTLVNGSGAASIGSGVVTFTTASGVSTSAPNAPSATVAIPAGVDPWRGLDVSVRLATLATAGGAQPTGSVVAWLSITSKSDGKNGTYSGSDMGVVLTVSPDGSVNAGDYTPSFTSRGSSASGVVQRDGSDWLRLIFRDSAYSLLAGRGSSRPTSWTRLYSGTLGAAATSTAAFAQPANITLAGYRNSTTAEAIVIAWDDLAVTRLP